MVEIQLFYHFPNQLHSAEKFDEILTFLWTTLNQIPLDKKL
jgi:hypothetical protein